MSLGDRLAKLNVLQRSTRFKIVASILVVLAAVVSFSVWWTVLNAPDGATTGASEAPSGEVYAPGDQAEPTRADASADEDDGPLAQQDSTEDFKPRLDAQAVLDAVGSRDATLGVAIGVTVVTGVVLLIIWLGAGLTYLALALLTAALLGPLSLLPGTTEATAILGGVAVLAACFTIFVEGVRALLSGSHPVFAIARTVIAEAIRMKISLIFILILIGWLASLPWLLDDSQPLRYRVQTFLRNGSSGAFWSLALLTMFFSVATLSFEQRDKVVWSTVVKPVASWHYILGKWLGVMAINAALLAVAGSGIFLFTEYLRSQPAEGEIVAYVNESGSADPTTDRLILEARVLTARAVRRPILPPLNVEAMEQELDRMMEENLRDNPDATGEHNAQLRALYRRTLEERYEAQRSALDPAEDKQFIFPGLSEAKAMGRPVTLRYKVQSGANDPTALYAIYFEFIDSNTGQTVPLSVDTPLNIAQSIDLKPNVINDAGEIRMTIFNGDPARRMINRMSIRFPPDGLEVYYVRGGYEMNFTRIMTALWVKLGFIAAAGIFAATFLSFPVAALLSFLVLFAAETSGFLDNALDVYASIDESGNIDVLKAAIRFVTVPIAAGFAGYRTLDATDRLVDGELLSWSEFGGAGLGMLALTAALLGVSVWIFKKRELAIYSGH